MRQIGKEHDAERAEDSVENGIGKSEVLSVHDGERDTPLSRIRGRACTPQHARSEVDADSERTRASVLGCRQEHCTGTRGDVEYTVSRLDAGRLHEMTSELREAMRDIIVGGELIEYPLYRAFAGVTAGRHA
jgi:hypothetical protein